MTDTEILDWIADNYYCLNWALDPDEIDALVAQREINHRQAVRLIVEQITTKERTLWDVLQRQEERLMKEQEIK